MMFVVVVHEVLWIEIKGSSIISSVFGSGAERLNSGGAERVVGRDGYGKKVMTSKHSSTWTRCGAAQAQHPAMMEELDFSFYCGKIGQLGSWRPVARARRNPLRPSRTESAGRRQVVDRIVLR